MGTKAESDSMTDHVRKHAMPADNMLSESESESEPDDQMMEDDDEEDDFFR